MEPIAPVQGTSSKHQVVITSAGCQSVCEGGKDFAAQAALGAQATHAALGSDGSGSGSGGSGFRVWGSTDMIARAWVVPDRDYHRSEYPLKSLEQVRCGADIVSLHDVQQMLTQAEAAASETEIQVLELPGPFALVSALVDPSYLYGRLRSEQLRDALDAAQAALAAYSLAAVRAGMRVLSVADPESSVDLLGPRAFKETCGRSLVEFLQELSGRLGDAVVHVCGRTSHSLVVCGLAEPLPRREVWAPSYLHAVATCGKLPGFDFAGLGCLQQNTARPAVYAVTELRLLPEGAQAANGACATGLS
ncbi:MAG: hypothetical protein LBD25_04260 [Coriobacteriales bacterium]|jgi:hypothetical protein|nr:hypothetical protein [Coriobacteriales bacterium]